MTYGSIFTPLLSASPLNPLGPGRADQAARANLKSLSLDAAFAPHEIVDREMAEACLAGLFLLYDCFDESHTISQEIDTPRAATGTASCIAASRITATPNIGFTASAHIRSLLRLQPPPESWRPATN